MVGPSCQKNCLLDVISLFKPAWSHLLTSKRLHHQTTMRINAGSCVQDISSKFNYFYKLIARAHASTHVKLFARAKIARLNQAKQVLQVQILC